MIIFSRRRDCDRPENLSDTQLAQALANQFETHVLSIPFLYDLRSFGGVIERLREIRESCCLLAPFPIRASKNLLISRGIYRNETTQRHPLLTAVLDTVPWDDDIRTILSDVENVLKNAAIPVGDVPGGRVEQIDEPTVRRWYPIVDTDQCTGCLECVNFCLFGVYTIGKGDVPIVDQPDACRDGCPACSRVCPGSAIMFPMHDDPIISGRIVRLPEKERHSILADAEKNRYLADAALDKDMNGELDKKRDELDDLVDQVDEFSL